MTKQYPHRRIAPESDSMSIKMFLFLAMITLFLSAAVAVAEAQGPNGKPSAVRKLAQKEARKTAGVEICFVEGGSDASLYRTFTDAAKAAMKAADQETADDLTVACVTYDKK